jgi:hypothetical protein
MKRLSSAIVPGSGSYSSSRRARSELGWGSARRSRTSVEETYSRFLACAEIVSGQSTEFHSKRFFVQRESASWKFRDFDVLLSLRGRGFLLSPAGFARRLRWFPPTAFLLQARTTKRLYFWAARPKSDEGDYTIRQNATAIRVLTRPERRGLRRSNLSGVTKSSPPARAI